MKQLKFLILNQVLAVVLTIVALTTGQSAWAQNFSVSNSTSGTTTTFTIQRTGSSLPAQNVYYRTVCENAFPQEHFIPVSGTLSFAAGETSKTVSVTERTPTSGPSMYTTTGYHYYRFEVLDQYGFRLAYSDRGLETGSKVTIYNESGEFNLFSIRKATFYEDIRVYTDKYGAVIYDDNGLFISDDGYDSNPYSDEWAGHRYLSLPSTDFYDAGTQSYLHLIGAQLRMTFELRAWEWIDGYQYVQILTDNTETCDNRSGCSDGDPGNINLSRYMAGFSHYQPGDDETPKEYTFPVMSVGNDEEAANPWGYGTDYPLKKQKFNTGCRASDGRIILNSDFHTLVLRLNASGSGDDYWYANSIFARVSAVDETRPTAYPQSIIVSAGPYNKGNDFYISIPFNEIMATISSLNTTWGTATLYSSSGTNVLTFRGTITADVGTTLRITGASSIPKDLAGNNLKTDIFNTTLPSTAISADPDYTITYDYAGGSVATANPTTYKWGTPTFSLNNPTRAGYTFAGWIGSNGDTPNTAVSITNHSHGDRSYTATWTKNVLTLANGSDNSETIETAATSGKVYEVTLSGRTLQAGGWNTFCAPFSVATPSGWTMKKLTGSSLEGDALTLTFDDATSIEAGKPYLVMVDANVVNPTFSGVTVVSSTTPTTTTYADFVPVMNPTLLTGGDKSVLFVSGGNTLTYPTSSGNINAFRAYFKLKGAAAGVKAFNMSFEEDADGIGTIQNSNFKIQNGEDAWYDLSGRKMANGKSSNGKLPKGIYIHNGRKEVMK